MSEFGKNEAMSDKNSIQVNPSKNQTEIKQTSLKLNFQAILFLIEQLLVSDSGARLLRKLNLVASFKVEISAILVSVNFK